MILKSRIPIFYLLNELKVPLSFVSLIALLSATIPPEIGSYLADIPISMATTFGIVISILLSYMINQSYERWWEARKIWGEIVNDSRRLVLQLIMYLRDRDPEVQIMAMRQIAWSFCLGQTLRHLDTKDLLIQRLSDADYLLIKDMHNIPLGILSLQTRSIKQLYLDDKLDKFSQIQLENTLARLIESMGQSERIKNTVFPPVYKTGLHVTIYLFVVFLSLSVVFRLQHFLLGFLILQVVSSIFFFLEKVATRMQDPFENTPTDTPITAISENIERNILELLGDFSYAPPVTESKSKYYVI